MRNQDCHLEWIRSALKFQKKIVQCTCVFGKASGREEKHICVFKTDVVLCCCLLYVFAIHTNLMRS